MSPFGEKLKLIRIQRGMSQEEMGNLLGTSKQVISRYESGKRTPMVTVASDYAKKLGVNLEDFFSKEEDVASGRLIPVLGRVPAGVPLHAVEDIVDYEEIPESMARLGEHFALRISGSSMEPKISDGDVVIVRKQEDVDNGAIAIVLVNGEDATCKKVRKHENGLTLVSTNPAYEPMYFSNEEVNNKPLVILGKVVELRAKF